MSLRAIVHASEVLTGAGVRERDGRRVGEDDLGRIEDGAVVYSTRTVKGRSYPQRIVWVGATKDLPKKFARLPKTNLKNRQCVVPGLIDCHTHLVFAGNRAAEFADRCGGASYKEIAARGGGIVATVRATREASVDELLALAKARVEESAAYGVRTIEIKSGYGLSLESELKCLEVVKKLCACYPGMTFTATFLGAHAFPSGIRRETYVKELVERMLPEIAKRRLADTCDVFIDDGFFTIDEGRLILERAKSLGLQLKVHADELVNTEAASLAAELEALSADHLLRVSDYGISALAHSETVAVVLPGTAFYLKADQARARALISAGACVALSTDFNPGTSMTLSLPAVMTIAALYLGLTKAEIFAGVTYNAAKALGLAARKGTIEVGKDADLAVLPFTRFEETYYRFAWAPLARAKGIGR